MQKPTEIEQKLNEAGFTKGASYELFILAVSLLSFVNLVLLMLPLTGAVNNVIFIVDGITALLFFIDFLKRFFTTKTKGRYFFKQFGWSDLLASVPLPAFNVFRMFRVVRFFRLMRLLGVNGIVRHLRARPADTALYSVFFMIFALLEFGSIGVLLAEQRNPEANIKTASDAIWWVYVSITTVGYGDRYPVTNAGRIVGVLILTVGVGLFGVVTAYIANTFLGKKSDQS